ncbi:MAG: signal peptidase I [Pyrinomonadaceae bacterium]
MRTFIVCTILVFCCLAISCRGWAYRVPTENMLPTIKVGDTCIINKFEYSSNPIQRFDIVVLNAPDDLKKRSDEKDIKIIKRIIGLPNEKIEIKNNRIYINDKLLDEEFEKIVDDKDVKKDFSAITISENEYFLLGDNRPDSFDSRYWKKPTIEKVNILGKVVQIIPAKEK